MTRSEFIRSLALAIAFVLIAALLVWPAAIQADQAQYFYDALSRLRVVVDGQGNTATYNYDAVGNLLSITRGGASTAPTITAISPDTIDAGTPVAVTINGTGLNLASLKDSHPEVVITNLSTTDTTVTATFTAPNPTTFGATTVTVTALGGTATTLLTVRQPTPTITQLTPNAGVAGTTVVIHGTGFGTKSGSNHVTFAGLDGVRLPVTVSSENNTSIKVMAPSGFAVGPVTVEVGGLTSNGALFRTLTFTGIVSTAAQGTATSLALPSANVGQVITLQGAGFTFSTTTVVFPTTSNTGEAGTITLPLFVVSPDGTTASVAVPSNATTGLVTVAATGPIAANFEGAVSLQIVPTVTNLSVPSGETVRPGVVATLEGSGFKAGATSVTFPGAAGPVPATAIFGSNSILTVTVPAGVTSGFFTVSTDGGTSNSSALPVFQTVTAMAMQGLPLNGGANSANTGQMIQLQAFGSGVGTQVFFPSTSGTGVAGTTVTTVLSVSPGGTLASLVVPADATTGAVVFGVPSAGSVFLQIVPVAIQYTVPAGQPLAPGVVMTILGSGFKEGATAVEFPGATASGAVVDVLEGNGVLMVTIPSGFTPPPPGMISPLTVRTDGGISFPPLPIFGDGPPPPGP
jgi:YD repeat-containing protein